MPDDMSRPDALDGTREEIFRAAEEALARQAPGLPASAAGLLRRLFAALPTADLAARSAEALAADAASLWALAARRPANAALVRLVPPMPGRGAQPVAEIVTDDMPFLVDSALAALTLHGRGVGALLHPIVPVRRDAEGRLLEIVATGQPESMMRIELGAPTGRLPGLAAAAPDDPASVEAALARAMADVRVAVGAFPALLGALDAATAELAAQQADAAANFLRWMRDDNFVLLGHRLLRLAPGALLAEEELGLLADRKMAVFDALRDLTAVAPQVRAAFEAPVPLSVLKANMRATVHRPQHADVVFTRVVGADGSTAAVRLFFGLFAATAYNRNPRSIPWLAEKVTRIVAASGLDPQTHDGRALHNIIDTWPRDELFQAADADILRGARRALDLTIRPRPALVVRHDPFDRFISAIAWLPRDTFDTRLRERVGSMLARVYNGRLSAFYIALGDAPLARVHYVIATQPGAVPVVDEATLEVAVAQVARSFAERLGLALAAERGEAAAAAVLPRWRDAFPAAYLESASAIQGVADIQLAERALETGRPAARLDRAPGADLRALTLTLANPGGALPLADALPLFESLDLRAVEEQPFRLEPADARPVVLHVFTLRAGADCDEARFPDLLEALAALLAGRADVDGFNRLVLRAGLGWRECWLLRAMYRWLKQVGFGFAQESVQDALAAHPEAARILMELFRIRFDPAPEIAAGDGEASLDAAWRALLDAVANPDEDRILTRLRTLLEAMLRTNYFRERDYLSFKIDSAKAGDMPAPRPWREIFVHATSMEGCHLRAGPVARGGIRWSDRREDFRTEILGLMKAQRLKNVVIVPTGAKGGFVMKSPPSASEREAFMAAGIAAYRLLVQGLLDITDNLHGETVVPPDRVVRRDADDPYLVVAADKGTATFSDIANGMAIDYGFWLGDAFASGGSKGYDHKVMGITARGAWVMIARHFAELGHDIFTQPFTCVGVGDMSGDVFGNGLLITPQTRLIAAFDHRHIFLDPMPDAAASFAERRRLFALPRSSWADYDVRLVSEGGGVFPRNAKTIPLSPQVRAMLELDAERAEPAVVMQAILRARADLLYFGGIGTYLKASTETQAEAGDRANDALRIDGREVRVRVIGEGANLGVTQAGRIEAARAGARINTDALDNSAGVSTSDHEVNIKILLADAQASGALTDRQRDDVLQQMTDEVAALVLTDNAAQSLAVSLEVLGGTAATPAHAALMTRLEAVGLLDRAVAGLPDAATLAARIAAGDALTRPELAALLPFAKLWLSEAIEASTLPDEPALVPALLAYFPSPLRERFALYAERHRLKRELIATILANAVGNRIGPAGLARLAIDGDAAAATRAVWLASECLGLEAACDAADAAPAPAAARFEALLALRALHEATARDLLASAEMALPLAAALAALQPGIAALVATETVRPSEAAARLLAAGLPERAARLAADAPALAAAPAIVRLARTAGVDATVAADAWAGADGAFHLDALRRATSQAPSPGPFGTRAKAALLDDLDGLHARLATRLLAGEDIANAAAARLAKEATTTPDLAAVTVALRAIAKAA